MWHGLARCGAPPARLRLALLAWAVPGCGGGPCITVGNRQRRIQRPAARLPAACMRHHVPLKSATQPPPDDAACRSAARWHYRQWKPKGQRRPCFGFRPPVPASCAPTWAFSHPSCPCFFLRSIYIYMACARCFRSGRVPDAGGRRRAAAVRGDLLSGCDFASGLTASLRVIPASLRLARGRGARAYTRVCGANVGPRRLRARRVSRLPFDSKCTATFSRGLPADHLQAQ